MQDWTKMSQSERVRYVAKERDSYREMVEGTAESIVSKLTKDHADERGRWNELFGLILHDFTSDHEAHTNPYLALLTLQYSDNACSGFGQGTGKDKKPDDEFPFCEFAADAFEDDVKDFALEVLKEQGINIDSDEFRKGEDDEDDDE